jgi:predicted molibdopterin-dependent oxidoreductase YjgC
MVSLKIDNIDCVVLEGTTIFEAAQSKGIHIPTLCHKEGLPHYSSCMVCMVKDTRSNGFIPSCSALVQPGMDIDASGDEVLSIRKKAVELLLSEHRAECEAPCRIVCPAGYNIPLINRLLAAGDVKSAIQLSENELNLQEIHCLKCPGYCENACRRKKIDNPVSIRNLKIFISEKTKTVQDKSFLPENQDSVSQKPARKVKPFASHIGKMDDNELKEWLKECYSEVNRFRDISNDNSSCSEAKSCMHCDCRASTDCKLRDISEEYSLKDPRGKLVNAPAEKKINLSANLIFENAKCIKCGLCVRISEYKNDEPQLCFINRGFVSIISEPLTCGFVETMKSTADECIAVCPTGALSYFK